MIYPRQSGGIDNKMARLRNALNSLGLSGTYPIHSIEWGQSTLEVNGRRVRSAVITALNMPESYRVLIRENGDTGGTDLMDCGYTYVRAPLAGSTGDIMVIEVCEEPPRGE